MGSGLTITTAAIGESSDAAARAGIAAKFKFGVHPHMLRHACGYALANRSRHNLGHKNIQHTVRYTEHADPLQGFLALQPKRLTPKKYA